MSQLYRPTLPATLAWGWLALLAAVGLLGPWLPLPYAPTTPDLAHLAAPPAWHDAHYLGTDALGRDVLAGIVAGARHLLLLTLPATLLATAAGALLGGAAGYWGNYGLRVPLWAWLLVLAALVWALRLPWWLGTVLALGLGTRSASQRGHLALPFDGIVLALTALLGAVPRLVLVLALSVGPALEGAWLLGLLALLAWPDTARLVRTQMLRVRAEPYVEAARALGLPPARVWARHALPAACQPLRAFAPLTLAALVGLESTLAFLGVNAAGESVSWGELLGQLRQEPAAWWLLTGPGLALVATLLALRTLAQRPQK